MYYPVNCTAITLVPKSSHAFTIPHYRPISCSVLYKCVSKILAYKMQKVVGLVVDPSQSGFIPRRQILDNILLASKLIKGYGRKGLIPRCI